jgi:hypothetical protein
VGFPDESTNRRALASFLSSATLICSGNCLPDFIAFVALVGATEVAMLWLCCWACFRASELQSFRASELQSFRASELQSVSLSVGGRSATSLIGKTAKQQNSDEHRD